MQVGEQVIHVHTAAFLIVGAEGSLLFDTSYPRDWPALSGQIDGILGDRPLDWVVPGHPEAAHGGNIGRLLEKYPDALLGGDVRDYHLYFPEVVGRRVAHEPGTELDLGGGVRVSILPAPIKDLRQTVWAYEHSQQVLFTADAFTFTHHAPLESDEIEDADAMHLPGECALMTSELGEFPTTEQGVIPTRAALFWTRYVPFEPFLKEVRELLRTYPTRMIAPSHGNVIDRVDEIMPIVVETHRLAYEETSA